MWSGTAKAVPCCLLLASSLLAEGLLLDGSSRRVGAAAAAPLDACKTTHPVNLGPEIRDMSGTDILNCYAIWHDATLAAWAQRPTDCSGRKAVVMAADHGLGDSGGHFAGKFGEIIRSGYMIFWDFAKRQTVWQHAMQSPFKWSFRESLHLFCLDNHTYRGVADGAVVMDPDSLPQPAEVPTLSAEAKANGPVIEDKFRQVPSGSWKFLYRPNKAVHKAVDHILQQVKPDEVLVGVHFRSQWFGTHFACGCKDPEAIACLASQAKERLIERGVAGFDSSTKVKLFVASDSFAGVNAFRTAFGSSVLAFPDSMPIEHSLDVSPAGAARVLADFMLLSKSVALVTSCGSTFSARVQDLSQLPSEAILTTGSSKCELQRKLNLTSFSWNMVKASRNCECYSAEDETELPGHGGTCAFQCQREEEARPSKCRTTNHASRVGGVPWYPQAPEGERLSHQVEDFKWLS